ncbi:MAG: hypothetical protein KGL41_00650 [Actinomycetales bacterium]|nr:hypothetical protein [Actinomycetales bacterium]
MTGAKLGAVVMTGLTVMYVFLLGEKGWVLLQQPNVIAKLMGGLILMFPAVAIWAIIRELIFGLKIEKLAGKVEESGQWPQFNFELRPSGRPTRESANAEFERIRGLVEANENDWLAWFTLGLAYDAAGDRRRARLAMRKALALNAQGLTK